jgi:nitrite reductase (NADH) small subunit
MLAPKPVSTGCFSSGQRHTTDVAKSPRRAAMAEFVFAARTDDIPVGRGKTVDVGEKRVALFNVDGVFYAIDDTCLHRGGPLGEGELEGCVVTCPWHGWKFDVRSGEMTMNVAARLNCYQTRVESGVVQISC